MKPDSFIFLFAIGLQRTTVVFVRSARYGSGKSEAVASAARQPLTGFRVTERSRETTNALYLYLYIL